MSIDAEDFIDRIRTVTGPSERIGLHEPDISDVEHQHVQECLSSTFVSSVGAFVSRFEQEIAAYTGSKYAVAVSNGTSALHVSLVLAGVQEGDEVLIPALSFVATANAVVHAGGVPHFVDSDEKTMGMSVSALKTILMSCGVSQGKLMNPLTGNRVAAIVPMHTLGHPLEIKEIVELANEYGIPVVEDSAESLGSFIGDQHTGTFGTLGILSFNGNKTITTGGGGMILTDDESLAHKAKHLTTTAKLPHAWKFAHDQTAWNFRLPNLNAALGVAQLSRLPQFLEEKRSIASRYKGIFQDVAGLKFVSEPEGTKSNYWLCSIALDEAESFNRDQLLDATNAAGIQTRPLWELLNTLPMYANNPSGDLSTAISLQSRIISLPSSPVIARSWKAQI